jgi:hypothetical protein
LDKWSKLCGLVGDDNTAPSYFQSSEYREFCFLDHRICQLSTESKAVLDELFNAIQIAATDQGITRRVIFAEAAQYWLGQASEYYRNVKLSRKHRPQAGEEGGSRIRLMLFCSY